jgi:hypothetical protein
MYLCIPFQHFSPFNIFSTRLSGSSSSWMSNVTFLLSSCQRGQTNRVCSAWSSLAQYIHVALCLFLIRLTYVPGEVLRHIEVDLPEANIFQPDMYDRIPITSFWLNAKNCHVAVFIHVFTNVFDQFNGVHRLCALCIFLIAKANMEQPTGLDFDVTVSHLYGCEFTAIFCCFSSV